VSSVLQIRRETPADIGAIAAVTRAAFQSAAHSSQTEHLIVDALRSSGVLTVSLVAQSLAAPSEPLPSAGEIVGHIAFSPVTMGGQATRWFGLGPLSVLPARQRQGIGTRLVEAGLDELRCGAAAGCVVLGDPRYYERFGFRQFAGLTLPGVPAEYFLALVLAEEADGKSKALAEGSSALEVAYHAAFNVPLPAD
jgi:putative acetyltransferase